MVYINCIKFFTTVQILDKLISRNGQNYVTIKNANKILTSLRLKCKIKLKLLKKKETCHKIKCITLILIV